MGTFCLWATWWGKKKRGGGHFVPGNTSGSTIRLFVVFVCLCLVCVSGKWIFFFFFRMRICVICTVVVMSGTVIIKDWEDVTWWSRRYFFFFFFLSWLISIEAGCTLEQFMDTEIGWNSQMDRLTFEFA